MSELESGELVAVSIYLLSDATKEEAFKKANQTIPESEFESANEIFWKQDKINAAIESVKRKLNRNSIDVTAQMKEDVREMFKNY